MTHIPRSSSVSSSSGIVKCRPQPSRRNRSSSKAIAFRRLRIRQTLSGAGPQAGNPSILHENERPRQWHKQSIIPAYRTRISHVLYRNGTSLLTLFTNGFKYATMTEERSQLLVACSRQDTIPLARQYTCRREHSRSIERNKRNQFLCNNDDHQEWNESRKKIRVLNTVYHEKADLRISLLYVSMKRCSAREGKAPPAFARAIIAAACFLWVFIDLRPLK